MSKLSELLGEWSETINAFWYGANGCEYVAFKGSHQIFVFPTWEYPNPPSEIIQHTDSIETLEDFTAALEKGVRYEAYYKETK